MSQSTRSAPDLASVAECCPSGLNTAMTRPDADQLCLLLKAVADPVRLQLLSLIRASGNGEACVCDLTGPVGLSQPTVSHHLKVLTQAGILRRDQRGQWAWFSIIQPRLEDIRQVFAEPAST